MEELSKELLEKRNKEAVDPKILAHIARTRREASTVDASHPVTKKD